MSVYYFDLCPAALNIGELNRLETSEDPAGLVLDLLDLDHRHNYDPLS